MNQLPMIRSDVANVLAIIKAQDKPITVRQFALLRSSSLETAQKMLYKKYLSGLLNVKLEESDDPAIQTRLGGVKHYYLSDYGKAVLSAHTERIVAKSSKQYKRTIKSPPAPTKLPANSVFSWRP